MEVFLSNFILNNIDILSDITRKGFSEYYHFKF